MRIVVGIIIALVAVLAITFAIGFVLPRNHIASSRATLQKPPEAVWAVVRDLGALVGVWPDLKSARRLADVAGKEVWEQDAGGFPLRLVVEESAPPARLVTRVDAAPDAPFGGTWTYQLAPVAGGTEVTVTENGYVNNALFRTVMQVTGVHRSADGYLKALGKKLGETVKPEHVR